MEAGIRTVCLMPERLPHQDSLEIIAFARRHKAVVIGPNSPGVLSPGKSALGGLGGRIDMVRTAFRPGGVGIISRSGGNPGDSAAGSAGRSSGTRRSSSH